MGGSRICNFRGDVLKKNWFYRVIVKVIPKEIIKDNFNGFLYEKNNSDDFKRKFIEIYEMSIKDNDKKIKFCFQV